MASESTSKIPQSSNFFVAGSSDAYSLPANSNQDLEKGDLAGRSFDVIKTDEANNKAKVGLAIAGGIVAVLCIAALTGLVSPNAVLPDTSPSTTPTTTTPVIPTWNGTVCAYEPPSGATFSALQDRINALGWDVNATAECAYPFIQKHADLCGTTLEGIPPQMRAVPEAYLAQLKLTVDQFNDWHVLQNSTDYAVVLDKNDPNALGVFEQALPHLAKLPKYVLPYELALAGNEVRNLAAFHNEHPEVKTFATFNFASYNQVEDCNDGKQTVSALGEFEIRYECLTDVDYWPTKENGNIEQCNYEYFDAPRNYTLAYIVPNMPDPTCVLPSSSYAAHGTIWSNAHDHIRIFSSNECNGVTING